MLFKIMSEHKQANKMNKELKDLWDNAENNQNFLQKMNMPSELSDTQPRTTRSQNCDKIVFNTNVMWENVVCNYT